MNILPNQISKGIKSFQKYFNKKFITVLMLKNKNKTRLILLYLSLLCYLILLKDISEILLMLDKLLYLF